jgi:hypothetical protein
MTGHDDLFDAKADVRTDEQEVLALGRNGARSRVNRLLQHLDPRTREVIRMRTGHRRLRAEMTLEQIGQHFGITKERVRQINVRGHEACSASGPPWKTWNCRKALTRRMSRGGPPWKRGGPLAFQCVIQPRLASLSDRGAWCAKPPSCHFHADRPVLDAGANARRAGEFFVRRASTPAGRVWCTLTTACISKATRRIRNRTSFSGEQGSGCGKRKRQSCRRIFGTRSES